MTEKSHLTTTPPLGWNSYDSFGCAANESVLLENAEIMGQRLKQHGYEYFVIDNGWFAEYEIAPGDEWPRTTHAEKTRINEFGIYQPSLVNFPNGFGALVEKLHSLGLRFGIHIMRGIPRQAVEQNTPIQGSDARAADIADTESVCRWCPYNYGVDMSKPGAQAFYDSFVAQLAEWGVEFIKADDIVNFPEEILAVRRAIDNCGKDIVFSLSPGGVYKDDCVDVYKSADMIRITKDIWDRRQDLDWSFEAMEKRAPIGEPGFWPDLDMIPFGELCVWREEVYESDLNKDAELLGGKGVRRMSLFTPAQKRTFMVQRALIASPLFMGGDLRNTDEQSWELITHSEVLAAVRNGVVGGLMTREGALDIWKTPVKDDPRSGWIGVFNRSEQSARLSVCPAQCGFDNAMALSLTDCWTGEIIEPAGETWEFDLEADDVAFLLYRLD